MQLVWENDKKKRSVCVVKRHFIEMPIKLSVDLWNTLPDLLQLLSRYKTRVCNFKFASASYDVEGTGHCLV